MTRIDLNGTWTCTLPDQRSLQIRVPGCWDTYVEEKDIGEAVHYSENLSVILRWSQLLLRCFRKWLPGRLS